MYRWLWDWARASVSRLKGKMPPKSGSVDLTGLEVNATAGRLADTRRTRQGRRPHGHHEYEKLEGRQVRQSDGQMMEKLQVLDYKNNRYTETLTNEVTGEVVHHTHHPLSEHKGHGSAKRKKRIE